MSNGSLYDKLQIKITNESNEVLSGRDSYFENIPIKVKETPISWRKRIDIAIDTADGINFLHNSKATPLIHRDIKSANILLDDNFVAKVSLSGDIQMLFI